MVFWDFFFPTVSFCSNSFSVCHSWYDKTAKCTAIFLTVLLCPHFHVSHILKGGEPKLSVVRSCAFSFQFYLFTSHVHKKNHSVHISVLTSEMFGHTYSPAQIQCDELTMQHTPRVFPGIGLFLSTYRSGIGLFLLTYRSSIGLFLSTYRSGIGLFLSTYRSGSRCTSYKHQHTCRSVNPLHSPFLYGNCALWLAMFHQSSLRCQAHHHLTVKYQNVQHALCTQIALSEKAPTVQVDLAVYADHWLSGGRFCGAVLVGPCSHKSYSTLMHLNHAHGKKTQSNCWSQKLWKLDTVRIQFPRRCCNTPWHKQLIPSSFWCHLSKKESLACIASS